MGKCFGIFRAVSNYLEGPGTPGPKAVPFFCFGFGVVFSVCVGGWCFGMVFLEF